MRTLSLQWPCRCAVHTLQHLFRRLAECGEASGQWSYHRPYRLEGEPVAVPYMRYAVDTVEWGPGHIQWHIGKVSTRVLGAIITRWQDDGLR